jgi:hypothetical protein
MNTEILPVVMAAALCGVGMAAETNETRLPVGPTRLSLRPGLGMTPRFQQMDTDGDGKISFEEFSRYNVARYTPQLFAQLDIDSSGALEISEIASESDKDFMRLLDTDADGVISRKEFTEVEDKLQEAFDRWDKNRDGFLTENELTVLNRRFGKRRQRDVLVR